MYAAHPKLAVQNIITQNHYGKAAVLKSFIIWTNDSGLR